MRTIKVKPLTAENFKHYGTFASMVNPEGPSLGDFYNDQARSWLRTTVSSAAATTPT